jgi:excisionase family DNA binding protein
MSNTRQSITGVEGYFDAETSIEILFPGDGICLRTFRKLQAQGYIPYLKLGRRVLFNPSEVRAALEKRLKREAVQL